MIAIIILNYNIWEDTIQCVESIEKYNTHPVKIIVVDNASPREGTVVALDNHFHSKYSESYQFVYDDTIIDSSLPRMTLLASSTNRGYAQGNNKGIKLIEHDGEIDKILILNNDTLFIEDMLPALDKVYDSKSHIGIITPLMMQGDGKTIMTHCARYEKKVWDIILNKLFLGFDFFGEGTRIKNSHLEICDLQKKNDLLPIEMPSGACMLISKEKFFELGLFDSNTFLYYEEDILCQKTKLANLQNYIYPSVRFIHFGAHSTSTIQSTFHFITAVNSSNYYLRRYCNLTFSQKLLLVIANFSEHCYLAYSSFRSVCNSK